MGGAAMARKTCLRARNRRCHPHASFRAVRADGIRSRQKSARVRRRRRRSRGSDLVLLRSDRAARRVRRKNGIAGPRRRKRQRVAPVWRVGCHLAFQFPSCTRRGTGWRRACRRKHGGLQARERYAAVGGETGRDGDRSRTAAWYLQLCHRPRFDGRSRN